MSCSDIRWDDPEFTTRWVYYVVGNGLATPAEKRRLTGQTVKSSVVHNFAVSKAVEYPDHFTAFRAKHRVLGEKYEPKWEEV
jgi:hypothetical protein